MKPDWDKLIKEYEGHETTLVADVDCTAGGSSLCNKVGVRGYPTIKYGDPNEMEDYQGGRDMADLQKFAKGLKPSCSPAKLELCDDAQVAKIQEIEAMGAEALDDKISELERDIRRAEARFKKRTEKLQEKYKEFEAEKESEIKAAKDSGLGMLKAVKANLAKKGEL
jgi:hypothetical protein